ncbi:arginine--tRNA ligase [Jeotgalibaca sp. MA1X17-3]|uniref:arginine--tRNA ligase n=1 Tax=Jeotgalibaca sp. MA1X17-3 TaxID=2908211 RepID=UPI001F01231F|nr:arginine--tRNA ligase [Jeotgalibaca sp. MA1X17-3]UJF15440.1 arginine--tRNA ligase [Jeotgalibaca sp. MA1X17-3]
MDYKKIVATEIHRHTGEHLSVEQITNLLENPKHSGYGDVAFPAFSLSKVFRKAPQAIASELAEKIENDYIEKVEPVGPYLNIFLNKEAVSRDVLHEIASQKDTFGDLAIGNNQNIPIDMSSPNIAKPISMGHLRSTVIGNALANIVEKVGFHPVKINHLGDWGTQFGKLIVGYKKWGSEVEVRKNPIAELLKLYVRFHEEAESNLDLEDEARAWFKKLEDGDQEAQNLWEWFRNESLKEFMKIYEMLDITFDSFNGEAFYNDKMGEVVELLEAKNLLTSDQGATIVDLEEYGLNPALIKKKDGATLYITRDLAAAIYRQRTYNFAQSLYVVGNEQSNHFKQLKAVLKELGLEWAENMHHIPFGLITQGGKKLSTRKGKIILLEEVLNEATELAIEQINEKNPTLENKEEVAKQVGIGAVVFHDLKNDRLNNFDFVLKEVVQFEGETGPYVQYTNARALSILRKASKELDLDAELSLSDDYAWDTIKLINSFPDVILHAYEKFEPSVIAKYSLQLSQSFNKYYGNSRILQDDEELNARLVLVKATTIILQESLRLLGVKAPEKM